MDHREFQTLLCASNERATMWKPLCKIEAKKLEQGLLVHIPFYTFYAVVTRQEISAHCLKWSKKCKEAFTSPILAVLYSTFASAAAPSRLVPCSSVPRVICGAYTTNMHVACSVSPAASDLSPKKREKISFITSIFHYAFLNESAPVNYVCSFGYTWQVEYFVQRS